MLPGILAFLIFNVVTIKVLLRNGSYSSKQDLVMSLTTPELSALK